MTNDQSKSSWWKTIPGVMTAVGGLITAIATLIVALNQVGLLTGNSEPKPAEMPVQGHTNEQTTDGWAIIGKAKSGEFSDLVLMVHGDSPAIGRSYDAVKDFRLIQKRVVSTEDSGQVITLGMVRRGDSVELIDLFIPTPSTETVPVWGKLRAVLDTQ